MSYTPNASDKDRVRLLIGDTDSTSELLLDAEIDYFLTLGGVTSASIMAARAIAAKFSRRADETLGQISVRYSQRATAYLNLANELEDQQTSKTARAPRLYAGGISIADKKTQREDSDRDAPWFARDQHSISEGSDGFVDADD